MGVAAVRAGADLRPPGGLRQTRRHGHRHGLRRTRMMPVRAQHTEIDAKMPRDRQLHAVAQLAEQSLAVAVA